MRATLALAFAFALAFALVPGALALDSFPQESKWGVMDARVLVRLPTGGRIHVESDPPVDVALADPGGAAGEATRAPADFDVAPRDPGDSWHGLPGTVELDLHRSDSAREVQIFVEDDQAGAAFEWPAQAPPRHVPAWGGAGVVLALACVASARIRKA